MSLLLLKNQHTWDVIHLSGYQFIYQFYQFICRWVPGLDCCAWYYNEHRKAVLSVRYCFEGLGDRFELPLAEDPVPSTHLATHTLLFWPLLYQAPTWRRQMLIHIKQLFNKWDTTFISYNRHSVVKQKDLFGILFLFYFIEKPPCCFS